MNNDSTDWDDSALIDAFERAVKSYSTNTEEHDSKEQKDKSVKMETCSTQECIDNNKSKSFDILNQNATNPLEHLPTVPSTNRVPLTNNTDDEHKRDLSALLSAWYYAGYHAGRYEALHCAQTESDESSYSKLQKK